MLIFTIKMSILNKDRKFAFEAAILAESSTERYRHGAVAIAGNVIVAEGYNITYDGNITTDGNITYTC